MQNSRIGPFALEEPLGGAADSNVLRAVHVERQTSMAIKLLPRHVAVRAMGASTFPDDVKVLQRLQHPNIAHLYGGAIEQGQPYLALELVDGESLRERLDRRGKLPWDATVEIADAVCDALRHAHEQGVVHRRLTPSRILLTPKGGVKLIGFDCAWADHDEVLGLHSPMNVAYYLAPEEFRGKKSASLPTCDLFSLGVILYECLSGELPWPSHSPAHLVRAERASPAARVSTKALDCPIWLDVLVMQLLAVKRQDRPTSAEETHRAIVDAQRKVASGMGAAQHAWSGRQGRLSIDTDRSELRQLRRSQRRRQRDDSPFYERAWFLAASLVALVGFGIWAMMPLGEEALFAKAQPLMESDAPSDWRKAEALYLHSFRKRFPDSKHAEQLQKFGTQFDMHRAETRTKNNERLGRPAQSEAEQRFAEASRYKRFGDRLTAWQKYEALVRLFNQSDDAYDQAYVNLARRQIGQIKQDRSSQEGRTAFVEENLSQAESLIESGQLLDARRILSSIVSLYDGNREMKPLVDRAREMIHQLDSDVRSGDQSGDQGGDQGGGAG